MFMKKKKQKTLHQQIDLFDGLPDDVVVFVLCKLSFSARCPSDFFNILTTCKRLNRLGLSSQVLSAAGSRALAIKAKNWSEQAHRFLKHCVKAGNVEACYILGMIQFYCLQNRVSGASLMGKAAIRCHAVALYSLAVIQFNGSGSSKDNKDLQAGVELCIRAARLGHVNAIRELGHCFLDGYGVCKDITKGSRLLLQAKARDRGLLMYSCEGIGCDCSLPTSFKITFLEKAVHPANQFLIEWFGLKGLELGEGLRLCSYMGCGRPETRWHEFRRCSACGMTNYCSRGCQTQDWKQRHKVECHHNPTYGDGEYDREDWIVEVE